MYESIATESVFAIHDSERGTNSSEHKARRVARVAIGGDGGGSGEGPRRERTRPTKAGAGDSIEIAC